MTMLLLSFVRGEPVDVPAVAPPVDPHHHFEFEVIFACSRVRDFGPVFKRSMTDPARAWSSARRSSHSRGSPAPVSINWPSSRQ